MGNEKRMTTGFMLAVRCAAAAIAASLVVTAACGSVERVASTGDDDSTSEQDASPEVIVEDAVEPADASREVTAADSSWEDRTDSASHDPDSSCWQVAIRPDGSSVCLGEGGPPVDLRCPLDEPVESSGSCFGMGPRCIPPGAACHYGSIRCTCTPNVQNCSFWHCEAENGVPGCPAREPVTGRTCYASRLAGTSTCTYGGTTCTCIGGPPDEAATWNCEGP